MTVTEIGNLISVVRNDYQKLYEKHKLSIESNGALGLRCFNPEVLEQILAYSDEEILEFLESKGSVIQGKEEYLAQLSK